MRVTRHATMWAGEGDFEVAGERCAHVWEPLDVNVALTAKPYSCLGNMVVFYEPTSQLEIGRCRHLDLSGDAPNLLFLGGRWWQVSSGQVVQRNGRWCVKWHLCSNTRLAREANAGREAERMTQIARSN